MVIKIMTGSEFGSDPEREIGKANRAFLTRTGGGVAPMPMNFGTSLRYDYSAPDITIVLEGYKTPMPQNTGSGISRGAVSDLLKAQIELRAARVSATEAQRESADKDHMIAVLVHMLGGSVTVSASEAENARNMELIGTKMQMLHGDILVLTTREK